jgi:hypothetical protein
MEDDMGKTPKMGSGKVTRKVRPLVLVCNIIIPMTSQRED